MILKALYDYYNRDSESSPYGWQLQSISFVIVIDENGKHRFMTKKIGKIYNFILEVGTTHYAFVVERYLDDDGNVNLEPKLVDVKTECKKRSKYPISIIPINIYGILRENFDYRDYSFIIDKEFNIKLTILFLTFVLFYGIVSMI